jgi:hypothetical protein
MDRYTRSFILASLIYLAAGGVMGASMRVLPDSYPYLRFAHIHVLLGGFMAMMVFGVGYFILPRFAARTLRWPSWVAVHFWLANASLVALVASEPIEMISASPLWPYLGGVGAILQAVSFLMFSLNLGLTLLAAQAAPAGAQERVAPERRAAAPAPARPASTVSPARPLPMAGGAPPETVSFGPETPVADVVDRKDGAREMLIAAGLQPLRDPAHFEMVRARGVTLGHACTRHGIPLEDMLTRLRALPDLPAGGTGVEIGPGLIIGELVERFPAARDVLLRRFGEGCFSCPGFSTETLAQGAMMHGVAVEDLLADLQRTIRSAPE